MKKLIFLIVFTLPVALMAQYATPTDLTDLSEYHDMKSIWVKVDDNFAVVDKVTDGVTAAELTLLGGMNNVALDSLADLSAAELDILDGATISTAQLNRAVYFDTVYVMVTVNMALLNPSDTATATEGMIYYDADDNVFYGRNNSTWVALDTQ